MKDFPDTHPFPRFGDVEGDFVFGDRGKRFFLFELAGLDERSFFGFDAFQKFGGGFVASVGS